MAIRVVRFPYIKWRDRNGASRKEVSAVVRLLRVPRPQPLEYLLDHVGWCAMASCHSMLQGHSQFQARCNKAYKDLQARIHANTAKLNEIRKTTKQLDQKMVKEAEKQGSYLSNKLKANDDEIKNQIQKVTMNPARAI